jgi:hypothetical protein
MPKFHSDVDSMPVGDDQSAQLTAMLEECGVCAILGEIAAYCDQTAHDIGVGTVPGAAWQKLYHAILDLSNNTGI